MSSNSLVSFQPPPYPDPLPDQFLVAILDFVPPKTQSCFGCRRHSRRYTTDKSIGLLENARGSVFLSFSHKIQKTNLQRSSRSCPIQYRLSKRIFPHKPILLEKYFPYHQLPAIEIYQPHSPLMFHYHKRVLHSLGIQI